MRQRVAYKIIHAGYLKSAEKTMDLAVEFMNTLEPNQVISVNQTQEGKVVVWYHLR